MYIRHLDDAPKVPFNLDGHILFRSEKLELIHLSLPPGEEIAVHANPSDVVFFVLSGSGELEVEGEVTGVVADSAIFVEAGRMRSWKNRSGNPLRLLVIKDLA